jgi:DNA-binding transcriptional ArsR family regulator
MATRSSALESALRALSHEQRLTILSLISKEERSVGEIERLMQIPQPAVSQQLARLRLDNLVTVRRDGRTIYYSINHARMSDVFLELIGLLSVSPPPSMHLPLSDGAMLGDNLNTAAGQQFA